MDIQKFEILLKCNESETLDFKTINYSLSKDDKKDFIKDIVCMWNTVRDDTSYIILGVKVLRTGEKVLVGLDKLLDDADLHQALVDEVFPIPTFSYYPFIYKDNTYAVIEIPVIQGSIPCLPIKSHGDFLKEKILYLRKGSRNCEADQRDYQIVYNWFNPNKNKAIVFNNSDLLSDFFTYFEDFSDNYYYVLITNIDGNNIDDSFKYIMLANWALVFDFYKNSDCNGLYSISEELLIKRRSCYKITLKDEIHINSSNSTYWCFANGLTGRSESLIDNNSKWNEWFRKYNPFLQLLSDKIISFYTPKPLCVLVVWKGKEFFTHLDSVLQDIYSSAGDLIAKIAIVTEDDLSLYKPFYTKYDATLFSFNFKHLSTGIESLLSNSLSESDVIPTKAGNLTPIPDVKSSWLNEELEIVNDNKAIIPNPNMFIFDDFYRGKEISWYEIALQVDVLRNIMPNIINCIDDDIKLGSCTRINIFHKPGAGGTTLSKRIAWHYRKIIPTAILNCTVPENTVERITYIQQESGLPILIIVDGKHISNREIDKLSDILASRNLKVVILILQRRFEKQRDINNDKRTRSFFLDDDLKNFDNKGLEASSFMRAFLSACPKKSKNIQAAFNSKCCTPFHFGIAAYENEYLGITKFVSNRLVDISEPIKKAILFFSIAHYYGQQSIRQEYFAALFNMDKRNFSLDLILPESVKGLLIREAKDNWRTIHNLVALECIKQILVADDKKRNTWKHYLADALREFIGFCRGDYTLVPVESLEIVSRVFVYRDNSEIIGTEKSAYNDFANSIDDISSSSGKVEVLKKLTCDFPMEAHFWAHLGRFYSIVEKDDKKALECIDKAIEINSTDHVLFHMRGMVFRKKLYTYFEQKSHDFNEIAVATQMAKQEFEQARKLDQEDEHGYISEIQMLLRVVEYIKQIELKDKKNYLNSPDMPNEILHAIGDVEELLHQLRQIRSGLSQSEYEKDCRAKLKSLYGNHMSAIHEWESMLGLHIYLPPIRRQIIYAYKNMRENSFSNMTDGEIEKSYQLISNNLSDDPSNEKDIRLFFHLSRYLDKTKASIDAVIEKVSLWKTMSDSLEATYYLFVLNSLKAIDGSIFARDIAERLQIECKDRARYLRNRTKSIEWLGYGDGISQLVNQDTLGEWDDSKSFWTENEKLKRVNGRIKKIRGEEAGEIEIEGGLVAFFVPGRTKSKFVKDISTNEKITCFIGFSYDGLRAWSVEK